MRFWIREFAGWILILIGLGIFVLAVSLLLNQRIFETGILTGIGFIIFRGGIHLQKVAVAARICMAAQDKVNAPRPIRTGAERPTLRR